VLGVAVLGGVLCCLCTQLESQVGSNRTQVPSNRSASGRIGDQSVATPDPQAEEELQKGSALTRRGEFSEAIPHLLAARGRVANEYAASFNLALCYVGSGDSKSAIPILDNLRHQGHENAAAISPQNEKLYLYVADTCTEHQDYALALKVVTIGLRNLPQSARLHYERGMVLSQLDEFDRAKGDFELVSKLAAGSEIGYVSAAQKDLFDGDVSAAVQ